jgi:hypothetical protein
LLAFFVTVTGVKVIVYGYTYHEKFQGEWTCNRPLLFFSFYFPVYSWSAQCWD